MTPTLPTITDLIEACVYDSGFNLAPTTVRSYHQSILRFCEYLETQGVKIKTGHASVLTMRRFTDFPQWLAETYPRPTRKTYLSGVTHFLDWLVLNEHVAPTPAEHARFRNASGQVNRKRESRLPKFILPAEAEALIAAVRGREINPRSPIRERDIAILLLLYHSGCRVSELTGLNVGDFDLVNRRAVVIGKGDKEAFIFFTREVTKALGDYWAKCPDVTPDSPAFLRHDNAAGRFNKAQRITPMGIRYLIHRAARLAALDPAKFTPHKFRHAFAIRALKKIGRIEVVQDLLRHASPTTTRVYTQISPEDLQTEYDRMVKKGKQK